MQHTPSKGALPLDASNNKGNHRKGGGTAAQTPSENDPRSRQTDWEPDLSYTENIDESSPLRERLSIVKESSSTRRSPDIASRAAPIDSVLTSVNSTEASTPLAVNAYRAGVGATHTPCESDVDAAAELASGNEPRTQKWPSPAPVSQRPTFYIYYAALGDENKCVEQARKWLLKEQHAYQLWLDNTVRTVVELQRKCEQEWTRRSNNSVQSLHHRPLGARRVLPPTLGELVRWRTDGGGSDAVSDVMTRSPITAAAFQYYYGNILLDNGMRRFMPHMSGGSNGTSDLGAGGASSNAGGFRNKGAVLVLPPSFASTRRNRVSKKARKMFKEERNGAGTVVLPFRVVQRQLPTQPPYTTASSSGASGAPLANPRYASMSALSQPPEPPTPQHQQQSWHTRPCNVPTSPRPYTMNKFMDMEEKCGRSSRVNERRLAEPGNERFGFKAGSGMALLEESLTSSPTPTHTSLAGVVTTTMPPQKDSTKALLNLQQRFLSDNIRVNRTETLDPATAELAAMTLSPTHWSSFHDMSCQEQPGHPESPQQSQPLPPSTSPVDEVASPDSVTWNSGSTGPNPLGSASQKLEWVQLSNRSNPSSRLYGLLTNADDSPSAATTMGLSDSTNNNGGRVTITDNAPPPGTSIDGLATPNTLTSSLAAQPLQPFYGSSGSAKVEVEDEGHSSAHRRDISSAPPQTLAYRRRANGSSNINSPSPSTNITAGSFSMNPQEGLNWIADHSKVAGFQVRVAARLFTTTAGVVCATAVGLVQQHGPPAMSALARLSNILRDTVFTSENVRIMQTVLTPMIMFCSVVVIVYLILGGEGDDEVFSLIENKGLL
ncbi:hypothetical protein JKF63_06095 [Porcisia hertigi]|uniref:Transmembrane protein n=1 Tax=Porcisia hertigi TaxID=2761500 RepID=A0A836IMS2_9TRYP|nr:hypothetical protein JKF63_06095 [Porcisia hertigi]